MYTNMDPFLVDKVVGEVKSQGIFDQFRKESMADVDTKPAYQNLRQRVEASVSKFLGDLKWKPEINKNHLREKLRKHITEAGFLDTGVERIVDQVVNPKISTVFQPKIEDIAYKYLGIEKPPSVGDVKSEFVTNGALTIRTDLLPTDLEAVSPDSDKATRKSDSKECLAENLNDSEDKGDDFESPPFEPLEGRALTPPQDEGSNQSHTSCISGLTSQDSVSSDHQPVVNYSKEIMSRHESGLSQVSSNSRLSVAAPEDQNSGQKTETEQKPTADMSEEAQMPSFPDTNEKNVKRTLSFDINNQSFKFEENSISDTHHSTASSETLKVSVSSENAMQSEYSNSMSIDETQKDSFLNLTSADMESNNILSDASISATSQNAEQFFSQDGNCHLVNDSFEIRHKNKLLQQSNMKANEKTRDTIGCSSSESEVETDLQVQENIIAVTTTQSGNTLYKNDEITSTGEEINDHSTLRSRDLRKKCTESDDDAHEREAPLNSMVEVKNANLSRATDSVSDKAKDSEKSKEQLTSSSCDCKQLCPMASSSIKTERIASESVFNTDAELVIGGSYAKNERLLHQSSKDIIQPKKGENFKGELLYFYSDPNEAQEFNTNLKSLSHIINSISVKKQKSYIYDCDEHTVEVLCHLSNYMASEKLAASGFDFGGQSELLINSDDMKTLNQKSYEKKRKNYVIDEDKRVSALSNNSKRQRTANNLSSKAKRKIADNIECETDSLVVVCYNDLNEVEQNAYCQTSGHDNQYNAAVNVRSTLKCDEERTYTEKQLECQTEKTSKISSKNEYEKKYFVALKSNQRYLNEDLYKPRAALGKRSRNRTLNNKRV